MKIKEWFLKKNFNRSEINMINNGDLKIIRETEKALHLIAASDAGELKFWCPKSCILFDEAEEKVRDEKLNKYEKLKQYAESCGIKTRKKMRKATLLSKFSESMIDEAIREGLINLNDLKYL